MDARLWWDRAYRNPINRGDTEPSEFAIEVAAELERPCRILELGSGTAQDGRFFAQTGHVVVGTDFIRQQVWDQARLMAERSLSFVLLDMRNPLPFGDAAFDVVYARLSLHYFSGEVTFGIFREISRVLRDGGLLAFLCKSTSDPLYGRGDQVGHNMFRLNGKVRHFFDEDFVSECLSDDFMVQRLWSESLVTTDGPSHVLGTLVRKVTHEVR